MRKDRKATARKAIDFASIDRRMRQQSDALHILSESVEKIFRIWDGFFKTLGVVASFAIVSFVYYVGDILYKLSETCGALYGAIIATVLFVIAVGILIWLVWVGVNALLVNKLNTDLV